MDLIQEQMKIVIPALNAGFLQTMRLFFVTLLGDFPRVHVENQTDSCFR